MTSSTAATRELLRRPHDRERDEHAEFMDTLTAEGFIVLGGPLGDGDGDDALLVINAPDEETVVSRLQDDPWIQSGILEIKMMKR